MTISVFNRQRAIRFDLRAVRRLAERALAEVLATPDGRDFPKLEIVEVTIVSDAAIAAAHEQFMQISGPTDVITFHHGEILISADMARHNAFRYHQPLERELALYVLHGLLHLAGFDDQARADAARMRRMQTRLLRAVLAESAA